MQTVTETPVEATQPTESTPAVEAPRGNGIHDLKAARRAKPAEAKPPVEAAKPAEKPVVSKTATIDVPDETLGKFVDLTNKNRTLSTRVKELEPKAAVAARLEAAEKLAAEGKHFDAIRALNPAWFDAAAREVLGQETPKVDPKIAELEAKLAALEGKAKSTEDVLTAEQKRVADEQRAAGIKAIAAEVKKAADKFPFLSRSDAWVAEALKGADEAYPAAVKHHGRDLTDAEKNGLIRAALETAEARRAEEAKLYVPAEKPAAKPTIDGSVRGGLRPTLKPIASRGSQPTLDELKRARRGN